MPMLPKITTNHVSEVCIMYQHASYLLSMSKSCISFLATHIEEVYHVEIPTISLLYMCSIVKFEFAFFVTKQVEIKLGPCQLIQC